MDCDGKMKPANAKEPCWTYVPLSMFTYKNSVWTLISWIHAMEGRRVNIGTKLYAVWVYRRASYPVTENL